jgi:hypothetical protein
MKHIIEINYPDYDLGEDHFLTIHKPVPAEEVLPEWYKKLENDFVEKNVKSCRGVYDVMTMGYMFVWNIDVIISKDENGKLFITKARDAGQSDFHAHPHQQMGLYPDILLSKQRDGIQKVMTNYRIRTPKGTSVLVTQPTFRPDLKTEVMPGIIDTGEFYTQFNVLFMIKDFPSNRSIRIPAGTPLAQVIPYKRTEWEIEYGPIDEVLKRKTDGNLNNIDSAYTKRYWTKKLFKRKK